MSTPLIFFIILLTVLGAITGDSFVFTLIYFISLSIILTSWWLYHTIQRIKIERRLPSHVFPGEVVSVELSIKNTGFLPVPWLYVQESISVELAPTKPIRLAFNLGSKGHFKTNFRLFPQKRGYYSIGPLTLTSGDVLGLNPEASQRTGTDHITVYPRILPVNDFPLRSRSPMGGIKNYQPLNEDPSRPIGKRDYRTGDSLRRIDWKSSAASRKLQVKLFEPSISYQTLFVLDLNVEGYHSKSIYSGSELAIVVAASLASWLISKKQAVGLISNGIDSVSEHAALSFSPKTGHAHLMKLLETLARISLSKSQSIEEILQQKIPALTAGTSLVIITGHCDAGLLAQLEYCYLLGKDVILILCGDVVGWQDIKHKLQMLSIPAFQFSSEKDFKNWQSP